MTQNIITPAFGNQFFSIIPDDVMFGDFGLVAVQIFATIRSFELGRKMPFCSNKYLAEKCKVTKRTIMRALDELVSRGKVRHMIIKGRRYLSTMQACDGGPIQDESDICDRGDKNVTPSMYDKNVTPSTKTSITKTNNTGNLKYIDEVPVDKHKPEPVVVAEKEKKKSENLDPEVKELAISAGVAKGATIELRNQYGNEKLTRALKYLLGRMKGERINNPTEYLRRCLEKGFADKQARQSHQPEVTSKSFELYSEERQRKYNAEVEKLGDSNHWMDEMVSQHIASMTG